MVMEQGLQKMKQKANLAVWAEQVKACRLSGLRVKEWCAENGINPNAYYRRQKKVFKAVQADTEPFYEIPAERNLNHAAVSIQINGLTAEIRRGADEETKDSIRNSRSIRLRSKRNFLLHLQFSAC